MDGGLDDQPAGQHPDLTASQSPAGPATETGAAPSTVRFLVLALLGVDGLLCAVATAFLLPASLGSKPFPISALIGGLVNLVLVWAASHWTTSLRLAALPLFTWLSAVAVMSLGGPGDDLIFAGTDGLAYRVLVMILLGSAPPAWLLWGRHHAALARLRDQT